MKPTLAYVGVGLMGLPMVKRLVSLGYAVRVYDIVTPQVEAAQAAGAVAAKSAADAARGVDFVLLNLPTTDAVEEAMFGADGAAGALEPPQLVVDFSTVKVEKGRAFAARLREATGCGWIDAPVSGGPPASATGTLTVMMGGDDADVARVVPFMNDVSSRCTHMGPPGAGLAAKMINARADTVEQKPAFRKALVARRCIVDSHSPALRPRVVERRSWFATWATGGTVNTVNVKAPADPVE